MADYPQAYRNQPGLDFIVDVPTTWDETRALQAELGKCLVIARRKGDAWYLGGMTADKQHELNLRLDFLGKGSYEADLYQDDPVAGPTAVTRRKQIVNANDKLRVVMPPSGGFVALLSRVDK